MMSDDMRVSEGLEYPVLAIPSVGHMPAIAKTSRRPQGVLCGGNAGDAEVGGAGGDEGVAMSRHHANDKRRLTKSLEMASSINWEKTYVGR